MPVAGSQIRTVPSSLAVASQVPSGAIATARTVPVWPVRVWRSVPVAGSQIRTVPSPPAVASQVPSGAIATARTPPVWPVRVWRGCRWPDPRSAPCRRRRRWPASCRPGRSPPPARCRCGR